MSEVFTFHDGEKRFEVRLRREEDNSFIAIINDENDKEKKIQVTAKVLGEGQVQFTLGVLAYVNRGFYEAGTLINITVNTGSPSINITANFSTIDSGYNSSHNETIVNNLDGTYQINIDTGN